MQAHPSVRWLGAQVSSAGGLAMTVVRGQALGCTAIQSFASSPRTINFTEINPEEISLYKVKRAASGITVHVFHGVYLINLAHTSQEYVKVCVESLTNYQTLAGEIGGLGTVFHVGSHKGLGLDLYLDQIAMAIKEILENTPTGVFLMLEMAAGHKGTIGQNIEELTRIFDQVDKIGGQTDKLAIGMDTQHAFASGYDLANREGTERLIKEIEAGLGLERLKVIHINDSAVPLASMRDRHANLGEGLIGEKGLRVIVNHPQLIQVPMILEVPGEKNGPRKEDVAELKRLIGPTDDS